MMLRSLLILSLLLALPLGSARGADQGIVATVNDFPITKFDIEQRLRLLVILGSKAGEGQDARKRALRSMIDEVIQIDFAKKYKASASDRDIDAQLKRIAKGLNTDDAGLNAKLQKQGIEVKMLRQFVSAQIAMNRILVGKYQVDYKVNQADVDKKFAEIKQTVNQRMDTIMKDPRMKPVTVYNIIQIDLPVEQQDDAGLLQARAVEAGQFLSRFKGCNSVQSAASGIFNVKIGKPIDAVAAKIPPKFKEALDKAGPGRAIGPARGPKGIQVIAFCGKRTIAPPKPKFQMPTRDQVESAVSNEKFAAIEEKYMKIMRQNALVEYKDPTFTLPQ
jgi:peptidyl-prolyl cis-trans isomerase SurA